MIDMICSTAIYHACVVGIEGQEGLTEFAQVEPNKITETLHKFILISETKNGLARGASVAGR